MGQKSQRVLHFERNEKGRDFVVGDIHGMFHLVDEFKRAVNFDPKKDRLFAVGDLVNRGEYSERVEEFLSSKGNFSIRGNHEQGFIEKFDKNGDWKGCKSDTEGHAAYHWQCEISEKKRARIRALFKVLPYLITVDIGKDNPVALVHGDIAGDDFDKFRKRIEDNEQRAIMTALHGRKRFLSGDQSKIKGVFRIYSGHTPTGGGVYQRGNMFFIDTGAAHLCTDPDEKSVQCLTFIELGAKKSDILKKPKKDAQIHIVLKK